MMLFKSNPGLAKAADDLVMEIKKTLTPVIEAEVRARLGAEVLVALKPNAGKAPSLPPAPRRVTKAGEKPKRQMSEAAKDAVRKNLAKARETRLANLAAEKKAAEKATKKKTSKKTTKKPSKKRASKKK